MIVSNKVGYLSEMEFNSMLETCEEISRLLNGLLKSLK